MLAKAVEIFKLGESVTANILQRQFLSGMYTLDTGPLRMFTIQSTVLFSAKSFLGYDDEFLASVIVRWRNIFSELRALLMQFGLGATYLEAFNKLQMLHLRMASNVEDQLIQLSDIHQKKVQKLMPLKSKLLLNELLQQSHEHIQWVLKPGEVLLEYTAFDGPASTSSTADAFDYLLLVLQPGETSPIIVPIAELDSKSFIKNFKLEAKPETDYHELGSSLIPKDIQNLLCNDTVNHVFLCLDPTMLYYLPFDLLPLPNGQLLGEKCTVGYLSAARELLRKSTLTNAQRQEVLSSSDAADISHDTDAAILLQPAIAKSCTPQDPSTDADGLNCFIYADPDFDLAQDVEGANEGFLQKMVAVISTIFLTPPTHTTGLSFACRLPKSTEEAHEVEYIMKIGSQDTIKTHCVIGAAATLTSVLQVKSPFILHFSTHGFSIPTSASQACYGTFANDTNCGLLLAGANTFQQGKLSKIVPAAGTGRLTALAAMGMDLNNTRLVYLSTCVSAQGPAAPGESVKSMAAAFRAAGAQTVVATLWNVLEDEARTFAVHFYYEACKSGVKPSQALSAAKKKMEESGCHWINWSCYVCIGEDVPLFPANTPKLI